MDGSLVLVLRAGHPPQNACLRQAVMLEIDRIITETKQTWPHDVQGFGAYFIAQRDFPGG